MPTATVTPLRPPGRPRGERRCRRGRRGSSGTATAPADLMTLERSIVTARHQMAQTAIEATISKVQASERCLPRYDPVRRRIGSASVHGPASCERWWMAHRRRRPTRGGFRRRSRDRNAPAGDRGDRADRDGRLGLGGLLRRGLFSAVAFGAAAFVVALTSSVAFVVDFEGALAGRLGRSSRLRRPGGSERVFDSAARGLAGRCLRALRLRALPAAMRPWRPSRPGPCSCLRHARRRLDVATAGRGVELAGQARLAAGRGVRVDRAGLRRAVERRDGLCEAIAAVSGSPCGSRRRGPWRRRSWPRCGAAGGCHGGGRPVGRA